MDIQLLVNYAIVFAGVIIAALLFTLVLFLWGRRMETLLNTELERAATRMRRAADHYVDVSAVVAMMRQLDELDEDAVASLRTYPENVRAAAWLNYINHLGTALQEAQGELADAYHYGMATSIEARQRTVDELRVKLDQAIDQSGRPTNLRAI